MRTVVSRGAFAVVAGASFSLASVARAQQAPAAPPPTSDVTAPVPVPTDLLQVQPGGITADQVGARAAATSWNAKAAEENLRGAAARVDEAWAGFLPRLTGAGKYTRVSDLTPAPLVFNGVSIPFPKFFKLDNWLLQASITIPISDYLLRLDQSYTAATRSHDAARWDVATARATAFANGKTAYYTWLRARGAVVVAVQALNDQKNHLRDARNQFAVGNASKADVLRAETAVASAELAVEQATNLANLSEKQLRVAIHAADDAPILPGEDLEAQLAPIQGNVKQMTVEAIGARAEVKSADANAAAAREQASAAKAGRYPVLSAFADGIEGFPNPREIPPSNSGLFTWDLGAQITWSPNDVLTANGSVSDAQSRAAAIEANKNNVRDGIEVEVTQMWQGVREADFSIETSTRELTSAQEAYRVARELFTNGRGTSTTLTDAETDLTRARLDLLNAKANARIARIQLDHALGRDVRVAAP
jgi:outer membrane protein TolC